MNLFAIASDDQSVAILARIFGTVGGVLPATAGGSLLLGTLFKSFNTIMLTLGALMIVYTTVVGLMATAHEGEFMGKKWSGLWVPIRSLIGITALFPTASGYSVLQVLIMWVILQGVGAADMIWTTTLNYVKVIGSPINQQSFPGAGIENKIVSLFQNLSCQATGLYKDDYKMRGDNPLYYCAGRSSDDYCKKTNKDLINVEKNAESDGTNYFYKMGPNGACGTMSYCDPKSYCNQGEQAPMSVRIKCEVCKAQQIALYQIVNTLGGVAGQFSETDNQYVNFWRKTGYKPWPPGAKAAPGAPSVPDWILAYCKFKNVKEDNCCLYRYLTNPLTGKRSNFKCPAYSIFQDSDYVIDENNWSSSSTNSITTIYYPFSIANFLTGTNFTSAAEGYYMAAVTGALTSFLATLKPAELGTSWQANAQKQGWIMAGGFYNRMANEQNNMSDEARPDFNVTPATIQVKSNVLFLFRNNFIGANDLINQFAVSTNASPSPEMNRLSNQLNGAAQGVFSNWRNSLGTTSGNPLAKLQSFGKSLLITAEVLYPVVIIGGAIIAGLTDISVIALGTGGWGWGGWIKYIYFFGVMPVAFFILGICITFGGLLAVYVPLIPYIVFTLSALGWFISTIEAMVASPLIAIGILSPGGQHEILGKAEPALMLLLGVLLRPTLMIFGLMAAMLLSSALLLFVNNTFDLAMGDITQHPSILELILYLGSYTFLIVAVLNKCFSLVHLIPERVMTWIGGQAVSYGEGEGLAEVKRASEAVGGAAAGAAKGLGGAAQKMGRGGKKGEEGKAS